MVTTRKKSRSYRKFLSQLDNFYPETIIGNAVSDRQEDVVVNEGTVDQEFTVNDTSSILAANGNLVNV